MAVSLIIDNGRSWAEIRELAEVADGLGAYAVYVCDHFTGHHADGTVSDHGMLESMPCWRRWRSATSSWSSTGPSGPCAPPSTTSRPPWGDRGGAGVGRRT